MLKYVISILIVLLMINTSFSQNEYKTIVFEKVKLRNGENGLAFNELAMDKVYKKYLDFDKLKNDFDIIVLENKSLKLKLQESEKELIFEKEITSDLRSVIALTNNNHLEENKTIKKQLKKARLNTFKVAGAGAIVIALLVLHN